jgi:hypothetical protein
MKFILLGIERMTGTLAHLYDSVIIIGAIIGKIIDFIYPNTNSSLFPQIANEQDIYQDHCHALSILFNVPATIYTRKEEGKGEVSFGLVPGHAYSLIAVKKLSNGAQLVCVSNPSCSTLPLLTSLSLCLSLSLFSLSLCLILGAQSMGHCRVVW